MNMKVIKSDAEYQTMISRLSALMDANPDEGSEAADELDLLAVIIEDYERRVVPPVQVDPVEAILFRMDQAGLTRDDLIPYFGSKSKVSEVLNRKRELSRSMIRKLHTGLGIPLESLFGIEAEASEPTLEYDKFPLKEMAARGCFPGRMLGAKDLKEYAEELVTGFFASLGIEQPTLAYLRAPLHQRGTKTMDSYSLYAWKACAMRRARAMEVQPYRPGVVSGEWLREVVKLSSFRNGPQLASEFLGLHGIKLVYEPHFEKTYLDGAAFIDGDRPVVAVTLRHDRLDNFWFVLIHELVHVGWHLGKEHSEFVDDLDGEAGNDRLEMEADRLASEALIPGTIWDVADARQTHTLRDVRSLALALGISPTIIAGRIRHETKRFTVLSRVIGSKGQVSPLLTR
jgi:HTH-type transcriptional regulator/antitoxin HigA